MLPCDILWAIHDAYDHVLDSKYRANNVGKGKFTNESLSVLEGGCGQVLGDKFCLTVEPYEV
jgi:hypothetical protein